MTPTEVLDFWFEELQPTQWWAKDAQLDAAIGRRFGAHHRAATAGELHGWRQAPEGRLAEILLLDQFSRNIHRDRPQAFAWDGMALALAQEAVARGEDQALEVARRVFLYMPYMHSESLHIHRQAVQLFSTQGMEANLDFERRHLAILERFGRYPHRNAILGRASTAEEKQFLRQPDSGF